MNEFLNSESDIESFEEWEDISNTPFDIETNKNTFSNVTDAVDDMKSKYNGDDTDEKKRKAEKKRKKTYSKKYGIKGKHYENVRDVFGIDVVQRIRETFQVSSDQIMDLVLNLPSNFSSADVEIALEQLWHDLSITGNRARLLNEEAIEEAMELGFTYEEALELTQIDRELVPITTDNISYAIIDYVNSLIYAQQLDAAAREDIRERYAEHVRDRI